MGPEIQAALVDVGGTLWPDSWLSDQRAVEHREARLSAALPALTRSQIRDLLGNVAVRAAGLGDSLTQDTDGLVIELGRELGLRLGAAEAVALRRACCLPAQGCVELFPGAHGLLATIKQLGLVCVVISNTLWRDGADYRRDFDALGISQHVDEIISSLDIGFRKPHSAMFEAAIAAAGCPAERCSMIGNSELKDVLPAVGMGMRVIRVAIEESKPAASAAQAVVGSLAEAAAVLRGWAVPAT